MTGPLTPARANALSREEFVATFGPLFEHSPWVADRAWARRPFAGIEGLQDALERTVLEAPLERQLALIRAHPELAGDEAREGTLTAESTTEQASAGLDRLSPEERAELTRLNADYRERFGFPMVVAVRGHTKESIFAQARARLVNGRDEEVRTALGEIFTIAGLRLRKLMADDEQAEEKRT
jgi:2-oxo-4-hydroxy-4-carboxy-5-ureidoimidazoline decarboxylase